MGGRDGVLCATEVGYHADKGEEEEADGTEDAVADGAEDEGESSSSKPVAARKMS